jgi:antitoxin component YwqK of YwqJK toxin-antitoxin module
VRKKNGIYKRYHPNGQLCNEVNYIDGLRQGIFKSYNGNEQLEEEINYIDGKKV